jgi:hypothetical protein
MECQVTDSRQLENKLPVFSLAVKPFHAVQTAIILWQKYFTLQVSRNERWYYGFAPRVNQAPIFRPTTSLPRGLNFLSYLPKKTTLC